MKKNKKSPPKNNFFKNVPRAAHNQGILNHVILFKDWLIHGYMTKHYISIEVSLAATCLFTSQTPCATQHRHNLWPIEVRENISWVAFDCDRRITPVSQHSYFRHDMTTSGSPIWRTFTPRALQWCHRTKIQELANCDSAVFSAICAWRLYTLQICIFDLT